MSDEAVSLATLKQTIQNHPKRHIFIGEKDALRYDDYEIDIFLEQIMVCVEKLQKQQEQKMNVIIRIKSLKAREHFARRLGFENLGHLIGGHPLSTEWKESDWLSENLPPFLGKRKVKAVLGEEKP